MFMLFISFTSSRFFSYERVLPVSGRKLWRFTPRMFTFLPLIYSPSLSRVSTVRNPNLSFSMCSVLPFASIRAKSTLYLFGVSAVHSFGLFTLKATSAWSLPLRTAVVFSATLRPFMSLMVVFTFAPSIVWLSST